MEETLQHKTTTQCIGLSPTSARSHDHGGTQANHALTIKLDQSDKAAQFQEVERKRIQNNTLEGFSFKIEGRPINELNSFLDSNKDEECASIRAALTECGAKRSSQDAWHIYCVHLLGLDMFLTCDTSLIGQIKSNGDKVLREQLLNIVALPSGCCRTINLAEATEHQREQIKKDLGAFPPSKNRLP